MKPLGNMKVSFWKFPCMSVIKNVFKCHHPNGKNIQTHVAKFHLDRKVFESITRGVLVRHFNDRLLVFYLHTAHYSVNF